MTKPKFLITGGAGFLGLHLANHFASKGAECVLYDIAPFEKQEYPEGSEFVQADIRNREALEKAITQAPLHGIVHGAAALPLCPAKEIMEVNIDGTRNVLELAKKHKVGRVVQISSTAVYGVPKIHPLYESNPVVGVGPYGISKIESEKLCESFRSNELCVSVFRPKTFIGTSRLGVFQILYDWVQKGKRIPVIGNGKNRYQLLEVEDLCEGVWLALTASAEKANATFNIGATEFSTVNEDVGALCEYAKSGARVMATPAWLVKPALALFEALKLSPLYKWVYGTADKDSFVSTEKLEKELGWKPKYSNAQALIRSYQWYLEHQHELEKGTGVTHRIAWDQGILKYFQRWL